MNAEIISVGTEILLGEIVDTNAVYLSQLFAKLGIDVYHQVTVGDNEGAIINALEEGSKRSNLIVTIGGLGPTEDDITKQSLAKFVDRKLKHDPDALKQISDYFAQQNRPLTKNNERQALLLEGSKPIQNPNGLALGVFYHTEKTDYIVLPGPPSEFEPMVDEKMLPLLSQQYGLEKTIQSKTLHFVGIGEADLASRVEEIVRNQSNPTIALYFKPTDVTIRLTAKASSKEEAEEILNETKIQILDQVGEFFYAEGDNVSFTEYVVKQLIKQKITVTAAESLTGGAFESTIVETPGASAIFPGGFVTYADEVKSKLLGVQATTITENSVVSQQVAEEMALGAQKALDADIALSFTGAAGPDALEGHKAGNVWIGLARRDGTVIAKEFNFAGNRKKVRHLAVMNGFRMIWENIIQ
jgi:nicotinamide-nucleotide amidase